MPEPVHKSRKKRPVTPVVEVPSSSSLVQAPQADPPSTSKRSRSTKREEVDDGANAEVEDETTPVRAAVDNSKFLLTIRNQSPEKAKVEHLSVEIPRKLDFRHHPQTPIEDVQSTLRQKFYGPLVNPLEAKHHQKLEVPAH